MISHSKLREVLCYEPSIGVFTWREKISRKVVVGGVAGTLSKTHGYRIIRIEKRNYYANVLAWFYVTGGWPPPGVQVDHRNRVRSDNAWTNLRLATNKQNHENMGLLVSNTSGHVGVSVCKQTGRWLARITHNGTMKNLGRFESKGDAIAARISAERALFTHSEACI